MTYKDSIEWLTSLKNQIGQAQHQDLWHFGQALDEIIELLKPLAEPHSRLIGDFKLLRALIKAFPNQSMNFYDTLERVIDEATTIINAEVE